jgi:hypothetical protein
MGTAFQRTEDEAGFIRWISIYYSPEKIIVYENVKLTKRKNDKLTLSRVICRLPYSEPNNLLMAEQYPDAAKHYKKAVAA